MSGGTLLLALLQSEGQLWETIIYIVIIIVGIAFRLVGGHGRYSSGYGNEDAGLNSGCWFGSMGAGPRRHSERYFAGDDSGNAPDGLPQRLRQVYPPPAAGDGYIGTSLPSEPAPAPLPIIGLSASERLQREEALEQQAFEQSLLSNKANSRLRRNRYQQIQHYHEQVEERWRELLGMLDMLADPGMVEGWQSLTDGPFGINTAVDGVREILAEARREGISTARLVQCEAPLDTVQMVASHARQAVDPALPESTRQSLRHGVLQYIRRELPQLKANLFGNSGNSGGEEAGG